MYKKTTLKNGLRVVSHEVNERDSISIGFWIGVGGRYEDEKIKGVAHFLEHILFKGSQKYSCNEIKELIEGVGGSLNAFTSEEQTCYLAKIPAKHFKQTFSVLSDMVFHPKMKDADIAKEKTVIIEEIKMYRDLPQYLVLDLIDEIMWPKHPLGASLTGTIESVSGIDKEKLYSFHREHYSPGNIVVAVSGKITHSAVVNLVKRSLGELNENKRIDYLKAEDHQAAPRMKCIKKQIEQMHLVLGMPGYNENNKKRYALNLLSVILGGNMSSRLFIEIREKRGWAYSIGSRIKTFHDVGAFKIQAGVDNKKIVESIEIILKELASIRRSGITKDEFVRAKDYTMGQLMLALEDTMEHMLWIGESEIAKNKIRTLKEIIRDIERITLAQIKIAAREIFDQKKYNLAIVGPVSDEQEEKLKKLIGKNTD